MGIRTPDPDLAKVVLYQLSYAPSRVEPACERVLVLVLVPSWWACLDSNQRPHAYQACALTN
jgi:hypothetical protein